MKLEGRGCRLQLGGPESETPRPSAKSPSPSQGLTRVKGKKTKQSYPLDLV